MKEFTERKFYIITSNPSLTIPWILCFNFYWISVKTKEIGYTIDFSDDWFYVRYVFEEKKLNELKTQASKFVEDLKKKRIENKLKELEQDFKNET